MQRLGRQPCGTELTAKLWILNAQGVDDDLLIIPSDSRGACVDSLAPSSIVVRALRAASLLTTTLESGSLIGYGSLAMRMR